MERLYGNIWNVDLYVGSAMEKRTQGSIFGPTCTEVNSKQFQIWKFADRLYYEFKQAGFSLGKNTNRVFIINSGLFIITSPTFICFRPTRRNKKMHIRSFCMLGKPKCKFARPNECTEEAIYDVSEDLLEGSFFVYSYHKVK